MKIILEFVNFYDFIQENIFWKFPEIPEKLYFRS
jgi:hypothetical protein